MRCGGPSWRCVAGRQLSKGQWPNHAGEDGGRERPQPALSERGHRLAWLLVPPGFTWGFLGTVNVPSWVRRARRCTGAARSGGAGWWPQTPLDRWVVVQSGLRVWVDPTGCEAPHSSRWRLWISGSSRSLRKKERAGVTPSHWLRGRQITRSLAAGSVAWQQRRRGRGGRPPRQGHPCLASPARLPARGALRGGEGREILEALVVGQV